MKKLFPSTIFLAAVVLLLLMSGRAAVTDNKTNSIEGLVVPDNVSDRQPFSFAVGESIPGAQVTLQSIEGEVVQHASTDKYGRVFLAAGLPAGAYLISAGSHGQPIGKLEIKQRAADALEHGSQSIQLQNPPQMLKLSDPFSLSGHGFSPNYADMRVDLTESGKAEAPIILAATEDQLKLAPVQQLQPGAAQLRVTNQATGQSAPAEQVLLYNLYAELKRQTIRSGRDQTQLVVRTEPANLPMRVETTITSGPVDFGGGRKEAEAVTSNGQAVFPVQAEHGSGPFQLTFQLAPHVRHDDCKCNLATARCDIPDPGNVCWEWQNKQGQWSCGSH